MSDTTKQFTGNCVQCGEPITPADNQTQFNRNRGLHMNKRHGIRGQGYTPKAARTLASDTWRGKQLDMSPQAVARRAYARKWRKDNKPGKQAALAAQRAQLDKARQARWDNHRAAQAAPTNGAPASHPGDAPAVPCQLSECPVCHSRFYVVRGAA